MRRYLSCLTAFAVGTLLLSGAGRADDAKQQESAEDKRPARLVFRASEILSREMRRGTDFRVDERVPLVDDKFEFTIQTNYGPLTALGQNMLKLRLREMDAVRRLEMSRDDPVVDGAVESVRKTPRGFGALVRDPVGSVLRVPGTVQRVVRGTVDPKQGRGDSVTRRKLAVEVNCDPETTNPLLSKRLDAAADQKNIAKLATRVGMSALVPGLGLISLNADIEEMVATQTPAQINAEVGRRLAELGIEKPLREEFTAHESFTALQRLVLLRHLEALQDVENLSLLVEAAVHTESQAEALGVIHQAQILSDYHADKPIAALANAGMLVAVVEGGGHVLVVTDDYVTDRPAVLRSLQGYRAAYPTEQATLLAAGWVSPAAEKACAAAKLRVVENHRVKQRTDRTAKRGAEQRKNTQSDDTTAEQAGKEQETQ